MPASSSYTAIAITLHWFIAFLITACFSVGLYMVDLPFSPAKLSTFSYHKWIGITVFALVLVRLMWRVGHPPPALPSDMPRWQVALAGAVHALLYALMLLIPLTGWLYSSATGVPTVPFGIAALQLPDLVERNRELAALLRFIHRALNYSLALLVTLHMAAAIGHQMIGGHPILFRMLPKRNA